MGNDMRRKTRLGAGSVAGALAGLLIAAPASAQDVAAPNAGALMDMPVSQLRQEIDQRYQAALQQTLAADVVRAADSRYTWASEAKVACGIAIGYLKRGIKDAETVAKCDDFYQRMSAAPAPQPVAEIPPPPPAAECAVQLPISIFFDWDEDTPLPEGSGNIATVARNMALCGWSGLSVNGFADSSGTDRHNLALSQRRAANVAQMLESNGVPAASIITEGFGETHLKVETADGVREPANRRVEIDAATGNQ
jgi:outer membrane protein OmpA-like peptidoglycan-associated protein